MIVVYDDDFLVDRHSLHTHQHFFDERAFVIHRDDDGNLHFDFDFSTLALGNRVRMSQPSPPAPNSAIMIS